MEVMKTRQQRRADERAAAILLVKTGKPNKPFSWDYTLALVGVAIGIVLVVAPPKTRGDTLVWLVIMFAVLIYPTLHIARAALKAKMRWVQIPAAIVLSAILCSAVGYRVWPPLRRHTLTENERALFEKPLSGQNEPREEIQLVCTRGDEHACVYAAQFVNIFGEAGWKVRNNHVEPVQMNNPSDGIILFKHGTGKLDPDKWNSELWGAVTPSPIDVRKAFANIGIEPETGTNPELPEGVVSIYFGLEKEDEGTPTSFSKLVDKLGPNWRGGPVPTAK